MLILDIDMDFFLEGRVTRAAQEGPRPNPNDHGLVPWTEERTIHFLEHFNVRSGAPFNVVDHHDEVFLLWRQQIDAGIVKTPFHVVHIDAHSDLGMGDSSWVYLHTELLQLPLEDRQYPKIGNEGLNCGNFLLYAVANRWISQIDFVTTSSWHDDFPRDAFSDQSFSEINRRSEYGCLSQEALSLDLELMSLTKEDVDDMIHGHPLSTDQRRRKCGEPIVPFRLHLYPEVPEWFSNANWDRLYVAKSPSYFPACADNLFDIVRSYID